MEGGENQQRVMDMLNGIQFKLSASVGTGPWVLDVACTAVEQEPSLPWVTEISHPNTRGIPFFTCWFSGGRSPKQPGG